MSRRTCKTCGALLVKGENHHQPWCPKAKS
jgi:RNase P subunit RPR2